MYLLLSRLLYCQFDPGAKQISLSHSDVAYNDDVFSLFNNVSCLQQLKCREIGIYYSPSPFGLKELSNAFIAYVEPFSFGNIAIGGMDYGFELYREYKLVIGLSKNLYDGLAAGVALNYHSVKIKNYGSDFAFYADMGLSLKIFNELFWGFSIKNINRATFGKEKDQIPTFLLTGISYLPVKDLSLNCALEKETERKENFLFGVNYDLINFISIRTGFSSEVSKFTAGVGLHYSVFNLDYAFIYHNDLGLTHQAGIIIRFE